MGRAAAAASVLAALAALLLLLRDDSRPRLARPAPSEGEAEKRAKPEGGGGAGASSSAAGKRPPPLLRGTVAGPNTMPLPRAQVAVRSPAGGEIVFCDESGRYALPLLGPGRHLVEASFGIEMLPARKVVIAPAEGDPEEVSFQLLPPGLIRGEILFHGEPLDQAELDLWSGEECVGETESTFGAFSFGEAPPQGVPLELRARAKRERTPWAFLEKPLVFTFSGAPVDLGRVELLSYPALEVTVEMPDGTLAPTVGIHDGSGADGFAGRLCDSWIGEWLGNDFIAIRSETPVRRKLVLVAGEAMLLREVALEPGNPARLHAKVRAGPVPIRLRVVDEHGSPVRMRARRWDDSAVESDSLGIVAFDAPLGGLVAIELEEIEVPGRGWFPYLAKSTSIWIDAEAPFAELRIPLDGSLLLIFGSERGATLEILRGEEVVAGAGGTCLLSPLPPGRYAWRKRRPETDGRKVTWIYSPADPVPFDVAERGSTVLDLR